MKNTLKASDKCGVKLGMNDQATNQMGKQLQDRNDGFQLLQYSIIISIVNFGA